MLGGLVFGYFFVYSFDAPIQKIPFINFLSTIALWGIGLSIGALAYKIDKKLKQQHVGRQR